VGVSLHAWTVAALLLCAAPSQIGKVDLDQARALLVRARTELRPEQWELLDRTLAEAERAWERFDALARPRGKAAEVLRAAGLLPAAGVVGARALTAAEAAAGAASVGALFAVLGALWPATVADGTLPAWHGAQVEFATKLQAVVEAAQQVKTQFETARRPPGPPAPPRPPPRRRECEPILVPHLGGDPIHNTCSDVVPPNRFPGFDVLINGYRFDALQVGADVLWEIKTMRFEAYSAFVQKQEIANEMPKLKRERQIAEECGYGFAVGVSSAAHAEALRQAIPGLTIHVTGC
jgi:hypothetical protein